mmetsp:Transcript_12367/g.25295  ORF Transcript_12367/g.25295 Transcript_12367/m.25295 type:complete len:139 (+) Transcript_12367:385-801(+)
MEASEFGDLWFTMYCDGDTLLDGYFPTADCTGDPLFETPLNSIPSLREGSCLCRRWENLAVEFRYDMPPCTENCSPCWMDHDFTSCLESCGFRAEEFSEFAHDLMGMEATGGICSACKMHALDQADPVGIAACESLGF